MNKKNKAALTNERFAALTNERFTPRNDFLEPDSVRRAIQVALAEGLAEDLNKTNEEVLKSLSENMDYLFRIAIPKTCSEETLDAFGASFKESVMLNRKAMTDHGASYIGFCMGEIFKDDCVAAPKATPEAKATKRK